MTGSTQKAKEHIDTRKYFLAIRIDCLSHTVGPLPGVALGSHDSVRVLTELTRKGR
jgi:hypothetical protein